MTTVLVHNTASRSEAEARDYWRTKAALRSEHFWNLWTRRLSPYHVLADGTPIVLLNTWEERGGGATLSWLVTARDVRAGQFSDKDAAVRAIARWAGATPRWVRGNPYTADKRPDAGTAIYWRAQPIRRLDLPRPPGLAVRRHGWLETDAAALSALGITLELPAGTGSHSMRTAQTTRRGGQGRRLDTAVKDAIEARAVAVARAWCRTAGWVQIQETKRSDPKPWDLQGTVHGQIRYAEVKGTTAGPKQVEVTAGEVKSARAHGDAHAMMIVHGIEVQVGGDGVPQARGGRLRVFDPWRPDKPELTETRYTWRPDPGRKFDDV